MEQIVNHFGIEITDIHAHLLPEMDDGSRNMDETKKLLQMAYEQGIRRIIATPHYINRHCRMDADTIIESVEKTQEAAQEIALDFEIFSGQEILYFNGIMDALENRKVLTLAETRYILIEFPTNISYSEIFHAVRELVLARYYPVLAHIERYGCLRRRGCVEELIHTGACMQMNYSSLEGSRFFSDRGWCRQMVLEEKIHFLGTDMHRVDYRPPDIKEAARWLGRKGRQELFRQIAQDNPLKLFSDEILT